MRAKNWLLVLALVAPASAWGDEPKLGPADPAIAVLDDGHPVIGVDEANRVQNILDPGRGVCFWCCAEMVGRQYGIKPLVGLVDRVKETGIGWTDGAKPQHIAYWHDKLGVIVQSPPAGKTQETVAWIRRKLDEGRPVLAGVLLDPTDPRSKHVLLLTYLSYQKRDWTSPDGRTTRHDFLVRYIDPNDAKKTFEQPWELFWQRFIGSVWAYDVQPVLKVIQAPDRPNLTPPVQSPAPPKAAGKVVPQDVLGRVAAQIAHPTHLNNPLVGAVGVVVPTHVAVAGFLIEVPGGHPLVTGKVPSNQDIKDGVARPSDVLENNVFGQYYFGGYDYYAEFKERVRTGQVKLPDGPPRPGPREGDR